MHTATFTLEHPLLSHYLCAYFTKFLDLNLITITQDERRSTVTKSRRITASQVPQIMSYVYFIGTLR